MILFQLGLAVALQHVAPAASTSLATVQQAEPKSYTRNVAIVIWDGAEVLDWAGPSEVLESAGGIARHDGDSAFHVYTVSKTTEPIVSQRFVRVIPEYSIADAPRPDIVVLPGGGMNAVQNDPEFLAWAGRVARESEVTLSVCTGAFILAKAGLLDGKQATTWYGALDGLAELYPEIDVQRGRRLVDNGQFITTAGVSAGIDGSLHLVARLLGRSVANQTAEYMEYRWAPEPYLAEKYAALNPSLDANGRAMQQATEAQRAGDYATAIASFERLLEHDPTNATARYELGRSYYDAGQCERAAECYLGAAEAQFRTGLALYNAACCYGRLGEKDRAMNALTRAVEAGFQQLEYIRNDSDLELLHGDPRFQALLE